MERPALLVFVHLEGPLMTKVKGQTEVAHLHPSGSLLKILGRVSSCTPPHLELFV